MGCVNARLYDPVLGRFLGMDPYVQMPDFTQNFNRYSYALNNPLVYIDPSGKELITIIGAAIIGAAIGAVSNGIAYSVTTAMSGGQKDAGQYLKSAGQVARALSLLMQQLWKLPLSCPTMM